MSPSTVKNRPKHCKKLAIALEKMLPPGNTKGGSITVLLTSCLTSLDSSVLQIKTKIVSCHTADFKVVKQEVNGTMILPTLVFPASTIKDAQAYHIRAEMETEMRIKKSGRTI
jgi:hypothetical protein